jgi:hypothetical protein
MEQPFSSGTAHKPLTRDRVEVARPGEKAALRKGREITRRCRYRPGLSR